MLKTAFCGRTSGVFILDGGVCALRRFLQKQHESRRHFTGFDFFFFFLFWGQTWVPLYDWLTFKEEEMANSIVILNFFFYYCFLLMIKIKTITLTPSAFLFPLFPPERGMKTKTRKISRVTKKGTKAEKKNRGGIALRTLRQTDSKENFRMKVKFHTRAEKK